MKLLDDNGAEKLLSIGVSNSLHFVCVCVGRCELSSVGAEK